MDGKQAITVEKLEKVQRHTHKCTSGAVDACVKSGCEDILRWDMAETAKGGPFTEIVESDMFVPRLSNFHFIAEASGMLIEAALSIASIYRRKSHLS